jgi:hypothetical protein
MRFVSALKRTPVIRFMPSVVRLYTVVLVRSELSRFTQKYGVGVQSFLKILTFAM